jgi:ankyrin repeat protein
MVDALPTPRSLADLASNLNNTTLQTPYHQQNYLSPFASNLAALSSTSTSTTPTLTTPHFSPALTLAARAGNLATTRSLLDAGANPYPSPDLPAEHSPLFEAARHGHVRVTQMLLAERLRRGLWGTDRHLRDGRLIREAEERGDIEMVMLLSMEPEDVLSAEDLARTREGRGRSDSVVAP